MRIVLFSLMCIVAIAPGAFADAERSIVVTGTAVMQVVPDYVSWTLSIVDNNTNLRSAKKQNDTRVAAAMELIKALGTQSTDVQTSNVSVSKVYDHDQQGRETTFKHYSVARTIAVKQRDIERFDEFFDALIEKTGADVNFGWSSSRQLELRKEARLRAAQIAKEKAESMLAELGAKLGPVMSVSEESMGSMGAPAAMISNVVYPAALPSPDDEITGTFAPGAIDVRVSVNVKFAIAE